MFLQKIMILLSAASLFVSCKKDDTNATPQVAPAVAYSNVSYGSDAMQKMDIYLPAGRKVDSTKVFVMIHGGAWASGDKSEFAAFIDTIKRRWPDYAIFNINYRLSRSGLNVFPTQEMDTKAAIQFIYNKRNEYGISDNFTMIGASAGAHLALLQAYKNATPAKVKLVVDFFGPTDMNDLYNNASFFPPAAVAEIVGATPVANPDLYFQSSPLNFATNGAACPTIILQGSADPLVNATRQSGALRDKLTTAGVPVQYVEYAGKGHGDNWTTGTYFDAFSKIETFIAAHNP